MSACQFWVGGRAARHRAPLPQLGPGFAGPSSPTWEVEPIGDALIAAGMSAHSAEAIVSFDRGFPAGVWAVLTGPRR